MDTNLKFPTRLKDISNSPKFEVGDLVEYSPTLYDAQGSIKKQLGIVLNVQRNDTPLCIYFPDSEYFEYEYQIKFIETGFIVKLFSPNLQKISPE